MFASFHVHTFSVELNPFQFQARSLLLGSSAAQLDLPSGAYHSMPWQLIDGIGAQQTGDGAMVPRITSCCSDSSVGTYFARWNGKDHEPKSKVSFFVRSRRISQKASFGSLSGKLVEAESFQKRLSFRFGCRAHFLHQRKMQMQTGSPREEQSFCQRLPPFK